MSFLRLHGAGRDARVPGNGNHGRDAFYGMVLHAPQMPPFRPLAWVCVPCAPRRRGPGLRPLFTWKGHPMKRSEINAILRDAIAFCEERRFALPPFAFWTPGEWKRRAAEAHEVVACQMGWDITDFGKGDFPRFGLVLFTLRNGHGTALHPKPYAEKILIAEEGQQIPMHFHWSKMEDIIVRGGGNLVVTLFNADPDENLSEDEPVNVMCDGVKRTVPAGGQVVLRPGESITLPPQIFHDFEAEPGTGRILLGEVSTVNDDVHDNRFHQKVGRFPTIEEDEPPLHLLTVDYAGIW